MDELFVADNCPSCVTVESALRGRVPRNLRVSNIDHDPGARARLLATGVRATPTLLIGGSPVVGAAHILMSLRSKYGI